MVVRGRQPVCHPVHLAAVAMTEQEHIELLLVAAKARQDEIANCAYCQANKGQMHPPHFASPFCESGRRNHCSCEVCW
jgi:hypothetical protein